MDFKEHILSQYDAKQANTLFDSFSHPSFHALIINNEKISDEDFIKAFPHIQKHPFVKHAFLYDKQEYEMGKSIYHDAGAIYISDPSSLAVAYILNASKDDIVLDMCAAPGGKTIQTSLLMDNEGLIISNDLSYSRALVLSQNIERMGRKNVIVTSNDLSKIEGFSGLFTKILLDAPCSGSGMFRKDAKIMQDWTYEKVQRQVAIQKELIELAYRFLAPGGTIIYSTCSYSKDENIGVVNHLLSKYSDIHLMPLNELSDISLTLPNEGITLSPATFNGEGQYFCLLKKDGSNCNKKIVANSIIKSEYLKDLSIKGKLVKKENTLYICPSNITFKGLNIIRNGLKIGEINKNVFTPDHHLSHFLTNENSIELDEKQITQYLRGEAIYGNYLPGYFPVSYKKLNFGYVKSSNGQLKNHYPKGLRHN